MSQNWHSKVYKKAEKDTTHSIEWRMLRDFILDRDNLTCLRCDKQFSPNKLSVHHLIPRRAGGGDDPNNLVTLCSKCHDIVELSGYKTHAEIIGSYEEDFVFIPVNDDNENNTERPDWHTWVYGGAKNPYL